MTSAETPKPSREFLVRRVLTATFTTVFRHAGPLAIPAIVPWLSLIAPPRLAKAIVTETMRGTGPGGNPDYLIEALTIARWTSIALATALFLICFGAILDMTSRVLQGEKAPLWPSVKRAAARAPALILPFFITILFASMVISMVFTVTGLAREVFNPLFIVILPLAAAALAMWYAAMPVCVLEGAGPLRSLGRSRYLTRGARAKILAVFATGAVLTALFNMATALFLTSGPVLVQWVFGGLYAGFVTAFWMVLFAAVYHELRPTQEVTDIAGIVAVFD